MSDDTDRSAATGDGERLYHVDGDLVPAAEATVSVEDRGFAYGDAAFETIRAYDGDVFRWDAHAARLADTCETLKLDHGITDAELKRRVDETLAANDLADAYVRLSITRGTQPGTLDPRPEVDPTVVVIAKPLPRGGVGSDPVHGGPAALQTTKTRKPASRALPAAAKTHNYLNGILARLELRVTGADEALMLDPDGNVAEGATANLFFADGTALKTPSLDGPILPGVTRTTVIELAESEGIPVEEGTYAPDAVREADEAFLTNSTWEVRPVATVDGIAVDGDGEGVAGPLTTLLSRLFDRRVEERYYDGERL
ncbi:4-amino-4-deoxychorismate lyase [Halorubrum sp. C191]|uniref:aminotransferase class IV n=1 Tax=Halorubrum sp. C191 TaxID=1383842 RepID=UPI000B97EF84|nr:aminotransferase class IV [Halorubrum sp. C191]OYR74610.1 4-amino-4-deoxychorismate lyase [Halorubrum ezzemoulense]PHQ42074.1 4-amino-4-deoxychorismate lyase [Halorubrum sp. C191]